MAVPLSHCNTSRNVFTEEDLTPIVENLKWDDKEEQTAMADYFHPKSSDVQKRSIKEKIYVIKYSRKTKAD